MHASIASMVCSALMMRKMQIQTSINISRTQQQSNQNHHLHLNRFLKAFTDAAMQKNTVEELKQAFAKAWKMLEGTPEQHKAQDVYNIRRDELEGATA